MINIEQQNKKLNISYFNEEGDVKIEKIQIPDEELFEWVLCSEGRREPNIRAWDGRFVRKKKSYFLSKYRIEEYLSTLPNDIQNKIWSNNIPKKYFIDIEVKVNDAFPHPHIAKEEITTISFAHKNILAVFGTKDLNQEQVFEIKKDINKYLATKNYDPIKFTYLKFNSEYDMLYTFFNKYIQKMPLLTGWNFVQFDWKYLINRCKRLQIDPGVASQTGKLVGRDELPVHRIVVDYLEIYKKWDRIVFKENNTLDYVAKAATGLSKIKYNGTLQDLYEDDFKKYVFYNAIDSVLVQLIDKEISTMSAFLHLGSITKTELNRVFSPISMTENVLVREFIKRGLVIPKEERKIIRGNYEGAFVFTPNKNIYDWVASFDFASLYPSIMRQWNMSPESYIQNFSEELYQNFTKAVSGAYFDNSQDSAFKSILTDFYSQRSEAKKISKEIKKEIDELEKMLIY